jgi:hypothetical protein
LEMKKIMDLDNLFAQHTKIITRIDIPAVKKALLEKYPHIESYMAIIAIMKRYNLHTIQDVYAQHRYILYLTFESNIQDLIAEAENDFQIVKNEWKRYDPDFDKRPPWVTIDEELENLNYWKSWGSWSQYNLKRVIPEMERLIHEKELEEQEYEKARQILHDLENSNIL